MGKCGHFSIYAVTPLNGRLVSRLGSIAAAAVHNESNRPNDVRRLSYIADWTKWTPCAALDTFSVCTCVTRAHLLRVFPRRGIHGGEDRMTCDYPTIIANDQFVAAAAAILLKPVSSSDKHRGQACECPRYARCTQRYS